MSEGPPSKFKKQLVQRQAIVESDAPLDELEEVAQAPAGPPRKDPRGLSKVARLGLPESPAADFPLPPASILRGSPRQRIKILVKSIQRECFMAVVRSTNFFDIRAEYTFPHLTDPEGPSRKHIHLGEIYSTVSYTGMKSTDSYTGQVTPPHAWIIISGEGVSQWHYVHPACETELAPTFLLSIENYLMYMHLRIGEPLPLTIFDPDEDMRGWAGKTYQD